MRLLRRGITGIDAPSEVDFVAFKKAIYAASLQIGARVLDVIATKNITPNFHRAHIHLGGSDFSAICNEVYPIVAFVEWPIAHRRICPIDVDAFGEPLLELGFEVMSAAALTRSIEAADLQVLSEAERDQIKYWKPQCFGELVFNWWD